MSSNVLLTTRIAQISKTCVFGNFSDCTSIHRPGSKILSFCPKTKKPGACNQARASIRFASARYWTTSEKVLEEVIVGVTESVPVNVTVNV